MTTILREVLDAVLLRRHRDAGLYLEEDEDFLYLYDRDGKRRAVFCALGATFEGIRAKADKILTGDVK